MPLVVYTMVAGTIGLIAATAVFVDRIRGRRTAGNVAAERRRLAKESRFRVTRAAPGKSATVSARSVTRANVDFVWRFA